MAGTEETGWSCLMVRLISSLHAFQWFGTNSPVLESTVPVSEPGEKFIPARGWSLVPPLT
jgi:hypothetical protein